MLLTIPDASTLVPTIFRRISSSAWITTSCIQIKFLNWNGITPPNKITTAHQTDTITQQQQVTVPLCLWITVIDMWVMVHFNHETVARFNHKTVVRFNCKTVMHINRKTIVHFSNKTVMHFNRKTVTHTMYITLCTASTVMFVCLSVNTLTKPI